VTLYLSHGGTRLTIDRAVMQYFLFKLIPPRPTFPMDMSSDEAAIMQEHFAYWRGLLAQNRVVVYGPVMDPAGTYGVAVLEVEDEPAARDVGKNDPAIRADAGFSFQLLSMPDTQVRLQPRS
jgi:hypothetical protein